MTTRNNKRSSILKKRPSLASGSSNESSPVQSLPKISKKINFSVKNNVKEFTTQDERNTIWINSYEESAERFPNEHSSEENSMHPFAYQRLTSSSLVMSTTKPFSEHDKENVILPQLPQPTTTQYRHISSHYHNSVDMSLTMEDQEASRLKRENNLSTQDNTIHLLSDLNRFNDHGIRPLIQEEKDMDLTGEQLLVNVPKTEKPTRSPRKTIFFNQPLRLSVSIEDSVQIYDTKREAPVSERVIFRTNPIASKFPASFTRRLNQFSEEDMSFGLYFAPDKPAAVSSVDDSNAMNVSKLASDARESILPNNRRTIHFEQHNEIDETLLPEANGSGQLDQSKICKHTDIQLPQEDMSIETYLSAEVRVAAPPSKSTVTKQKNRCTIHFEHSNQVEETLPQVENEIDHNIVELKMYEKPERKTRSKSRETVYLNEDMDTATVVGSIQPREGRAGVDRKTMNLFEDIEKTTENVIVPVLPPKQKRQTIYCNETIGDTSLAHPVLVEVGRITNIIDDMSLEEASSHDCIKETEIRPEDETSIHPPERPAVESDSKMKPSTRRTVYETIDIQPESSFVPAHGRFQVCSETVMSLNLSQHPVVTSAPKMKPNTRKTVYDVIDIESESSFVPVHERFHIPSVTETSLNLSQHPVVTSDPKMKPNTRKTVYDAIDIESESSLVPDQENFQVLTNNGHAKFLQPCRTMLYDTNIDNSYQVVQDMTPVVQPHTASVMDVSYETQEPEGENQRLSARRTIMFGDNTVKANIETTDLSALQPLPDMSVINIESSHCSINSDINTSESEVNIPTRKTTYQESMEESSKTLVADEEEGSLFAEITIDVCRAAPFQGVVRKSLRIAEPTVMCDKTMTKIPIQTATPSKIPIAKHRLTAVVGQRESQRTFVGDVPEALLENVSDPCVESLEEDQPQQEQQTSSRSSTQTHNFERFRERYLNLTMPRFSDANLANGTLKTRQSFGSITNLMNYSTPSTECSAIMDEIKEKFRNFRPSDGTPNVSVMDKGKVAIDWSEYNAKIAEIKKRRAPLDEMMADMKSKMETLKLLTNSESVVEVAQDAPEDDQTKLMGAIFPLAPSFTSLWRNLSKCKEGNKDKESQYQIATIYPLSESFPFLLKNKIVTEMKSWILDDVFFNSGLLELHNKLLKTIKLRLYFNKPSCGLVNSSPVDLQRVRFMESHNVYLIRKTRHHKLIHLEFLHRHPFDMPPIIATNELTDFLINVETDIRAINLKVDRLFRICECFEIDIVENCSQLMLQKDYGDQLCEIALLDSGGNSNLAGLTRACIRMFPEMPEIMNKLVKYTGLGLLEVLFYELDKSKYQFV